MAGDWIKMRGNLWDDPRVSRLCDLTDQTEAAIVGALYWLWATADQHTENGVMPGLTLRQIDRKTGIQGFGQALCDIGWLSDQAGGVRIENFAEHNGASAKKRCQTAKRVAAFKSGNAAETQEEREGNASGVTETLAERDLEKRREEEEVKDKAPSELPASPLRADPSPPQPFDGKNAQALNGKSVVPLAAHWELPEAWGIDAEALGWQPREVLFEAEKFRQYWTAGKGAGTRRAVKGWRQSWSTWLGKAAERKIR